MYWLNTKFFLVHFFIASMTILVHSAEEDAQSKASKNNSAPAPGASNEKQYSGRQTEEWMIVQTQLTTMKGKVENQKKIVESLIQQKEVTKGAEQSEKIEELKKAHLEYIRVIEVYNQLNTTFQTKFPEKGGTVGRVYKRMDPATIETLQNKMSVEGRLQKLNKMIEKQYSKALAPGDKNKPKAATQHSGNKVPLQFIPQPVEKAQEVQVTDQIILQK